MGICYLVIMIRLAGQVLQLLHMSSRCQNVLVPHAQIAIIIVDCSVVDK